jgi:hypothetical protein
MKDLGLDRTDLTCIIKEHQHGKRYADFIWFRRGTSGGI